MHDLAQSGIGQGTVTLQGVKNRKVEMIHAQIMRLFGQSCAFLVYWSGQTVLIASFVRPIRVMLGGYAT